MISMGIRPASIADIVSIVEVRKGALTDEEISGFSVPEDNIFSSTNKLRKRWDQGNRLKNGFEVFVAESKGKIIGFIVYNINFCTGKSCALHI